MFSFGEIYLAGVFVSAMLFAFYSPVIDTKDKTTGESVALGLLIMVTIFSWVGVAMTLGELNFNKKGKDAK